MVNFSLKFVIFGLNLIKITLFKPFIIESEPLYDKNMLSLQQLK